jgi:hypothetical protein
MVSSNLSLAESLLTPSSVPMIQPDLEFHWEHLLTESQMGMPPSKNHHERPKSYPVMSPLRFRILLGSQLPKFPVGCPTTTGRMDKMSGSKTRSDSTQEPSKIEATPPTANTNGLQKEANPSVQPTLDDPEDPFLATLTENDLHALEAYEERLAGGGPYGSDESELDDTPVFEPPPSIDLARSSGNNRFSSPAAGECTQRTFLHIPSNSRSNSRVPDHSRITVASFHACAHAPTSPHMVCGSSFSMANCGSSPEANTSTGFSFPIPNILPRYCPKRCPQPVFRASGMLHWFVMSIMLSSAFLSMSLL